MNVNNYDKLLQITLKILLSHSKLTQINYDRDGGYNNDSPGMQEETEACVELGKLEPNYIKLIERLEGV